MRRTSTRRIPTRPSAVVQTMGDHGVPRCEFAYIATLLVLYCMFAATLLWSLFH